MLTGFSKEELAKMAKEFKEKTENSIVELKNAIERGILSETGLIVASDMKKAKEILNPDGSLEMQKTVAGEAIAFLADETAVSVRLIQYNPHGLLKFVYTIKATEI